MPYVTGPCGKRELVSDPALDFFLYWRRMTVEFASIVRELPEGERRAAVARFVLDIADAGEEFPSSAVGLAMLAKFTGERIEQLLRH